VSSIWGPVHIFGSVAWLESLVYILVGLYQLFGCCLITRSHARNVNSSTKKHTA